MAGASLTVTGGTEGPDTTDSRFAEKAVIIERSRAGSFFYR